MVERSPAELTDELLATRLKSAFQMVYLVIFLVASVSVATELTPTMWNAAYESHKSSPVDVLVARAVSLVFVIGVFLHSLRVYLTFEMMEDREPLYETLVKKLKESPLWVRSAEFGIRMLVILVVTFKATGLLSAYFVSNANNYEQVCIYLVSLYGALLSWSLFARFVLCQNWSRSYGNIALFGFLGSSALFLLGTPYGPHYAAELTSVVFTFHDSVDKFVDRLEREPGRLCSLHLQTIRPDIAITKRRTQYPSGHRSL